MAAPVAIDPGSSDLHFMRRALRLARRGEGRVEPNPMVGCVICRDGRMIGEGFHRRFGGPHAEVDALRRCGKSPRHATLYVTLEPCCHVGKTPPCTNALVEAGIARVVVACRDPNPLVDGAGIAALRRAGIDVSVGVRRDEAAELLAPFATVQRLQRPYVIAKWAQSLDGKLATRTGESRWITGEAARRLVHRHRARMDAILVGAGTVCADDPLLTARGVPLRRRALRVVLDGRLSLPLRCQLVGTAREVPTLVFTAADVAESAKAHRLRASGVEVVALRGAGTPRFLAAALRELARRGVTNLLVEGGAQVLAGFLDARLVDEALVFVAPLLIGGTKAPSAWNGLGVAKLAEARAPRLVSVTRLGNDHLYRLRLTPSPLTLHR